MTRRAGLPQKVDKSKKYMVDILLTHSYFLHFDPKEYRAMMPYPPLGTLYAGSYLKQRGYSIEMFDSMLAKMEEDIIPYIKKYHPKVVAIYDDSFNYLTKMCLSRMREAAFKMSKIAKEYNCKVIIFSSDATDHLDKYFKNSADFVIIGEAEETLSELVNSIIGGGDGGGINGIAYINNGKIEKTSKRNLIKNLNEIPFPMWELVDIEHYREIWLKRHGYFSMNVVTTRGCPFHCNWCAKPIYGQVYHSRSPENVTQELKILKEKYDVNHIWFCDDIFGLKPGWVEKFSEQVVKENIAIPFKCLSRVDLLLKGDTIQHLKKAGCESTWVGAESGSQKILDAMEKGTTVEQIYKSTELLHKNGIKVCFFLQFGYPGETKEDINKTIKMIKDCKPDNIGISVSYPLPGTKFYEHIKQKLGEKTNWVNSQDLALLFPGEYPPDFYRILYKLVHRKYKIYRGMNVLTNWLKAPYKINKTKLKRIVSMILSFPFLFYYSSKLKKLKL